MSTEQPIPLFNGLASGLEELAGAQPQLVNFLIDAMGTARVRPGIEAWTDFPAAPTTSPVIGIFPWRSYIIYATADRQLWAWIGPGAVVALSNPADTTTMLDGSLRPIWTYDATRVTVVAGGAPQQWQGIGLSSRLAPGALMPDGSALAFTHITYNSQRFIGNNYNLSGIWQWSDPGPGGHTSWPIVGNYWAEAEAAPDPAIALYANTNEVFVFGTQTCQTYTPDSVTVYAAGASVQVGCAAPYSVIDTDGTFAWLDDRHRFVQSDGRSFQPISTPLIANDIMQPGFVVDDCWGSRIHIGTWDLLVWIFPTMARGFAYDRTTKKWVGEFRSTNATTGEWVGWQPNCYAYWPDQNMHLVGMPNGTIASLSFDATTDLGAPLVAVAETGFQNRGTFTRKLCQRARLQFRRGGTAQPGPAPVVELKYRDDLGAFKPVIQWSAGVAGDYQPVVERYNAGMYRQRQWQLSWTGGGPFVMTGATESFELGDT